MNENQDLIVKVLSQESKPLSAMFIYQRIIKYLGKKRSNINIDIVEKELNNLQDIGGKQYIISTYNTEYRSTESVGFQEERFILFDKYMKDKLS